MAIDYLIDYQCYPKQTLSAEGILERLKGRSRAEAVIQLFRDNGDQRPVSEIGFELARNSADGVEETRVVMVQDMLDQADQLQPFEHYCEGCPANIAGMPFACFGQVDYPISAAAEAWLLKQLPIPQEPLPWILLRQGLRETRSEQNDTLLATLRRPDQPFFEDKQGMARVLGELTITSDQLFQMLFLAGHLRPSYAAMLLVFLNAIPRSMDADELMALSASPEDALERYPFQHLPADEDDHSTRQIKRFLKALHQAWGLKVRLLIDI